MTAHALKRRRLLRLATLIFGLAVWFAPVPEGLTDQAWHLFAIFVTAIFAVIVNAMPILIAAVLALVASILTGTLEPAEAYSGFGSGFILLIVVAFLIGRGVVNSGLGARIAYTLVRMFGKSTLGLGYSMVATDCLIAAAFPSNTARSGVLFPIIYSLSHSGGSRLDRRNLVGGQHRALTVGALDRRSRHIGPVTLEVRAPIGCPGHDPPARSTSGHLRRGQ